ncbi:MAG: hypothetical protein ACYTGN_09080 [Planctomycetota bacterium]
MSVRILLLLVLLLPGAAVALLVAGPASAAQPPALVDLSHGIGLGPAVDFERCAFAFDARIAPACGWRFGPMPNADAFCPLHSRGP